MKKTWILFIFYMSVLACSTEDELSGIQPVLDDSEVYPGDASSFSQRMNYINRTILFDSYNATAGRSSRTSNANNQLDYYWANMLCSLRPNLLLGDGSPQIRTSWR